MSTLIENENESPGEDYQLMKDKQEHKRSISKNTKAEFTNEESPIIKENDLRNEETLKKLWIVSLVCLVFMAIEITGGYLANSIAIMSDAAHLLSDFLGFIISIVSIYISRRGATHHMSFGFHRAEVIGALVSITLIWGLTIWLLYEATLRIIYVRKVDGLIMLITALIGFFFNIVMGLVLAYEGIDHNLHQHSHGEEESQIDYYESDSEIHSNRISRAASENVQDGHGHAHDEDTEHNHDNKHDHEHDHNHEHNTEHKHPHKSHKPHKKEKHIHNPHKKHQENHGDDHGHSHSHGHDGGNINIKAALIHVIGDAIQNLGVVCAGVIIYIWPSASIADPICTFVFSIIVGITTIRILKECISVLMEGSPLEFKMIELEKDLKSIKGVQEIHDLHVWSLSVGKPSLSCHLTSNNPQISLRKARLLIKNKYKISHSTIQVELDSDELKDICKHDLHHDVQNKNKKYC